MKRAIFCLLALALLLTGCSSGISQAARDTLIKETEQAAEQNTTLETEATEPATQSPPEAAETLPDAIVLIDETWENGGITVMALDEKSLWVHIVDDRPEHEYEDLGTPWFVRIEFGEPVYKANKLRLSPYVIELKSPAHAGLKTVEYALGNLPAYYAQEQLKPLWLEKTVFYEDGQHKVDSSVHSDLEVERSGDAYTALISLPEWFDVSVADDLARVDITLCDTDYWHEMGLNGWAHIIESYTFGLTEFQSEEPADTSDATPLIEEAWENGSITVIALDDATLFLQIVDDRPEQEQEGLGTLWELTFEYGEPINNGKNSPYVIRLMSSAFVKLGMMEYEQGNLLPYYKEEYFRTLWFEKTVMFSDGSHMASPVAYIDQEIDRADNTYTAIITFPEWFDVSAANDLANVRVSMYVASHWDEMVENGSVSMDAWYSFIP